MNKNLFQFIKFGAVGFSNNIIFYVINAGILLLLKKYELTWDFVLGNIAGFLISVLWSFYWNSKYVFSKPEGEKRSVWKTLLKTYAAYSFTGIFLNNLLGALWINVLGISKFIAPVLTLFISVPINFILNKFWAFRKS